MSNAVLGGGSCRAAMVSSEDAFRPRAHKAIRFAPREMARHSWWGIIIILSGLKKSPFISEKGVDMGEERGITEQQFTRGGRVALADKPEMWC